MRYALGVLILLAGMGGALWRYSGQKRPAKRPAKAPLSALAREMLAAHNVVRKPVGVPPLTWSDRLAAHAEEWATTLLAHNQFVHRSKPIYGENLFEIRGGVASSAQAVDAWASESRDYDYDSNGCRGVCGHYTQIVWRDTKEVGCAVARGGNREVWVCNYTPPGNWVGQRPY